MAPPPDQHMPRVGRWILPRNREDYLHKEGTSCFSTRVTDRVLQLGLCFRSCLPQLLPRSHWLVVTHWFRWVECFTWAAACCMTQPNTSKESKMFLSQVMLVLHHYVDGAVSDNLPRCHRKDTTTFSPYAGESDLCPRASAGKFHQVRVSNVSIQVNSENMSRVTSTFFPPPPQAMAEICQSGYADALRFLRENNMISGECPVRSLEVDAAGPACCEQPAEDEESDAGVKTREEEHRWLDPQLIENLPVNIQKALCEACRETRAADGLLTNVTSYLKVPCTRPLESAYSMAKRLFLHVSRDVGRLYGSAGHAYRRAWKDKVTHGDGESSSLRRSTSLSLGLDLLTQSADDPDGLPLTPGDAPSSSGLALLDWDTNTTKHLDLMHLTPPLTPTGSPAPGVGDAPRGWGLGRAVGWIRNVASEPTSDLEGDKDYSAYMSNVDVERGEREDVE
ncbi:Patatin-like phospholipase domain-containing protein 2 [Liparis tanakae]|uniref:Patatin-like phospholipase domain-containing protein 2 n=1 Tax=Liparis tanakae TaxID=230148 RepID=A0A4Z2FLZ6_9TELE|nr:Patatin-like phospholipase domain-containing protein 2 [Liparis tanakae]